MLTNVLASLGYRLRGHRGTVYESNLRLAVPPADLYTYPDASVFCEPMTFTGADQDTATNPTLIVEVLSKSTEAYVRGKKFELYRQLPSLREYLLVSQGEALIERFFREGDGRWILTTWSGLNTVMPVESLGLELPLAEVFDKVEFTPPAAATASG